ncbi:Mu transposase C-terminal domain-containing protein [Agrobacterium sp. NPDC058088]|uniref:Mu transposase C-terminal domain-containing protein n=1 Tax=Agrobacterium sp. NPDC058088 TaxID=3346335 RepID=UPI0036DBED0D
MPRQLHKRAGAPLSTHSDEAWSSARRVARELDRILEFSEPRGASISRAARELRISTRQVYNLLARYRLDRTVTSLLPRLGEVRRKRLDERIETIIATTLREQWLVMEAPPLAPVVAEIRARCEEAGIGLPSYVTVARRIPLLFSAEEIARRRSANPKHLRRLQPRPGYIHAERPLDVCQIDHTPTDINFIEVVENGGTFVGRAYLTIVTDVATRCILGFCLTLEKPSSLSVALCLTQPMCPKEEWLAERAIGHAWPMFGRPRSLVTDSAKEFKGHAFQRGCEDFSIAIRYRDSGRVHQGGVVERIIGKLNGVLAAQPGSTGRSVADRDGYPAQRRARLTFSDLERCIALAVIDHYTQENAKSLRVPETEWERRSKDLPIFNDDPMRVLLAFLPGVRRRLSPQGVSLFALDYYASWLGSLLPRRDRMEKLDIRYDPRDISHIYIRDTETSVYRPVGRRDGLVAPITKWEHEAQRSYMRATNARPEVEKVRIRRQIAEIAAAPVSRKAGLRDAVRRSHAVQPAKPYEEMDPSKFETTEHPVRQKRRLPVEDW